MHASDSFAWCAIEIASVAPQAWRNGGGLTRELLRVPDGAQWGCRISVAEIVRDGPFSTFPGIERHFALIEGGGLALQLSEQQLDCAPGHPPVVFDGAQACRAVPGAGLVRVCNLMLARERASGQMIRSSEGGSLDLRVAAGQLLAVLALEPVVLGGDKGITEPLAAGHLHWVLRPIDTQEHFLQLHGASVVMQVQFQLGDTPRNESTSELSCRAVSPLA